MGYRGDVIPTMPFDLLSVQGFVFFMVVLATGYSYVEIFMGDAYPLRASMARYGSSLFDRLMHYVLAGIVINVLGFALFVATGVWRGLLGNFNVTGKVAEALMGGPGPSADSVQFVVFSVAYFGLVTLLPTAALGGLWAWRKLNDLACGALLGSSAAAERGAPAGNGPAEGRGARPGAAGEAA